MAMSAPPETARRMECPGCGKYLGTVEGVYSEYPPCQCGVQTTVKLTGRRGRASVQTPCGPIEVKSR